MRRPRFRAAYLVVIGLLLLVGIHALHGGQPAEEPATIAGVSPPLQQAPLDAPAVVFEDKGRIEIVDKARAEVVRAANIEVQPLFEADMRVKLGETAKLKFAARDRTSRLPESGANVSASVFHGSGPALRLTVDEVDEGVYEVPFTPRGPGRFKVVLSLGGVPIGSEKVGVVGAVGATDDRVDIVNPLSVDPHQFHARTPGRGRLR
jgi:hypothetical protein